MTLLGNRIFIGINVDVKSKLIILMGMLLWLPDVPIFFFFKKVPPVHSDPAVSRFYPILILFLWGAPKNRSILKIIYCKE